MAPFAQNSLQIVPILESTTFRHSVSLKRLLSYLWFHQGEEFSEYAIATEALERKSDFDPKIDATVRVQIARLRLKLKDFYENEGRNCSILVKIPLGSHYLEVSPRVHDPADNPLGREKGENRLNQPSPSVLVKALIVYCAVLTIFLSSLMLWKQHVLFPHTSRAQASVKIFWQSFLDNNHSTLIALTTPTFFNFDSKNLHVRDVAINDFARWNNSSALENLSRDYGPLQLDQSYTVTSDALAAIALSRFLDSQGMGKNITFVDAADTPMDALYHQNEIALGTHYTLHQFQSELDRMDFLTAQNELCVRNRKPSINEPLYFPKIIENKRQFIEPDIIDLLPGRAQGTHLLILEAAHTSAMVAFLTSRSGLDSLEKMWMAHGSPPFYEAVVNLEISGDRLIRAWPVAMHAYSQAKKSP